MGTYNLITSKHFCGDNRSQISFRSFVRLVHEFSG